MIAPAFVDSSSADPTGDNRPVFVDSRQRVTDVP
jgi:hypothetical protein